MYLFISFTSRRKRFHHNGHPSLGTAKGSSPGGPQGVLTYLEQVLEEVDHRVKAQSLATREKEVLDKGREGDGGGGGVRIPTLNVLIHKKMANENRHKVQRDTAIMRISCDARETISSKARE